MNDQLSELSLRIHTCTDCEELPRDLALTVQPFLKPCAQFDIYSNWKPNSVSVVFIAESPPGTSEGYFYDPQPRSGYKEILRKALFDLLEISKGDTNIKLDQFKRRGFFLLDAIKCRCKKKGGQPPQPVTKTCARKWLSEELEEIGNTRRICILGKAALLALSELDGLGGLTEYSVRENCGEVVEYGQYSVLIWPFLGWRNERNYRSKISIFKEFTSHDHSGGPVR